MLYSLFTVEWMNQDTLGRSESAKLDDRYISMRKQVVQLLDNDREPRDSSQRLFLPQASEQCLYDALNTGALEHNCHRSVTKFEYTAVAVGQDSITRHLDECKAPDTLHYQRFLWAGSSSNHDPLAKLHPENSRWRRERQKPTWEAIISLDRSLGLADDYVTVKWNLQSTKKRMRI